MGVRGLLSYVLRHKDHGTTQRADLSWEAQSAGKDGLTLLVDLIDFAAWILPQIDRYAKECEPDGTFRIYGGEFACHDEVLTAVIFGLRNANVYLEFFVDVPWGCGLIDGATPGAWADEAKRRYELDLQMAKAVRSWCRGERSDLPDKLDEARCQPVLWYDQVRATLARCGCQVWHLRPEEQAPLLSLGRHSDWGHVYAVVSDNIDWAVVRGLKLAPMSCFDLDGELVSQAISECNGGWPSALRLAIGYTSADLLAEFLRLGHPPKEEEVREATAKGKGRGPVGYGQWPYKWWFDQVLLEVALLCGTDATTPYIQKHKLYSHLSISVGQDPVDSIVRWVRNALYSNKLRWRDVQLEALSPTISEILGKDREFELALQLSRAVYSQNVGGVRAAKAELVELRRDSGEKSVAAATQAGEKVDLPEASSLLVRSAALGSRVWLDVCFEDVTRNGAPLAHQLLADLRRFTYLLLRRATVQEHGISGEQRSGVASARVELESVLDSFPALQAIQRWPFTQRWAVFRKIVEHNVLQVRKGAASVASTNGGTDGGPRLAQIETAVWDAYKAACETTLPAYSDTGFLHAILEYFVSLNHRPEQPLIREHEFDSVCAMLALCCDASLPGAPLAEAPEYVQQRFGEVKASLCSMVSGSFHQQSEVRAPVRVAVLSSWFQAVCRHLLDLARLLWLDTTESGAAALVFLPEPRELFSGNLLAALYCGGAYDQWELQMPTGDNQYHWKGVFRQMSALRHEVISNSFFYNWRQRVVQELGRSNLLWPSREQIHVENSKTGYGSEELPIDEHRDTILRHIDKHRVTCIQGETGCGKSTRVPVYVMEHYQEKLKKGEITKDEKFMVLCTQPRRIACISLANRVATCLKEKIGDSIGYKISGDSCVRPGRTKLVYVTTGYLLQVLVNNPEQIRNYTHLILDEVHERDVDSDLLSLVVKLQMMDHEFKLVIMSATLQGDLFSRYFSDKKIKTIFVGVKRFPVEVIHLENIMERYGARNYYDARVYAEGVQGLSAPFTHQAVRAIRDGERTFGTGGYAAEGAAMDDEFNRPAGTKSEFDDSADEGSDSGSEDEVEEDTKKAVVAKQPQKRRHEVNPTILRGLDVLVYEVITRVANAGEGILIFLPGIGEISELHETLMPLEDPDREAQMSWEPSMSRSDLRFKVFALHSLIPKDEQEGAVFDAPASDTCHVILASNIAESSLTIPKVRVVIDFGLRRQLIYDKRRHMSCLVTTWVSQASAKQRCGRTGRVFEGVNIRLFTKQMYDTYMPEFDHPEMQTAPLEKLYVNVKHLSGKLPEYEVEPGQPKRKRSPKELLGLVAQPPEPSNIEASIQILDNLGALTNPSEEAELTVLGYLMMSVPLDVHLCRLVIFGAVFGIPCDGVLLAAGLSVQDPFTLPSHLIIKDPREYADSLRRSYETRQYFDQGHYSEPMMMRAVFIQWLSEYRQMIIDRSGARRGYRRESTRQGYLRVAQGMAHRFAIVPKRIVAFCMAVLDTSTRMRKFIPSGSEAMKKFDGLLALTQAGDKHFSSPEEAQSQLPKLSDIFCVDVWMLKALLIASFTPQFMVGSTKVRNEEVPQDKSWKKKKQDTAKKDKNKMEQLLDEMIEKGLDPAKTVAAQLEMPRGRGGYSRWHPRFEDDLKLTIGMITGSDKFSMVMSGDNKVLISFEDDEEGKGALDKIVPPDVVNIPKGEGLVQDLPIGAHHIDLFGAGRWKFTVPMLSSEKLEREQAEKEKAEKRGIKNNPASSSSASPKKEPAIKTSTSSSQPATNAAHGKEKEKQEPPAKEPTQEEGAPQKENAAEKEEPAQKEDAAPKEEPAQKEDAAPKEEPSQKEDAVPKEEPAQQEKPAQEEDAVPKEDAAPEQEPTSVSSDSSGHKLRLIYRDYKLQLNYSAAEKAQSSSLSLLCESRPKVTSQQVTKGRTDGASAELAAKLDKMNEKIEQAEEKTDAASTTAKENTTKEEDTPTAPAVASQPSADANAAQPKAAADDMRLTPEEEGELQAAIMEAEEELQEEEQAPAAHKVDDPQDLGPLVGIYKPVTPYEVNWEVVTQEQDEVVSSKKGSKVKKKKSVKARCGWRNSVGFLGSCRVDTERLTGPMPEPWPNDMYAVYTNTQGGDSKDLIWVDGVTLLPAEKDNLLAYILLVTFLRYHQDLIVDVDLQDGRIHLLKGLGGMELRPGDDQVLLVEDVEKINKVRSEMSKAFYTKERIKAAADERDSLDFSGYQSRRDDEVVPQIAGSSAAAEALTDLISTMREACNRDETISDEDWNSRLVLRKANVQIVDMHRPARAVRRGQAERPDMFLLFEPFTDLMKVKKEAEQQQAEEDERRRQAEEEKRRRKEEEMRRKQEDKRQRKLEEQRRKEEEKRLAAQQKKANAKASRQAAAQPQMLQPQAKQKESKGGKDGGKKEKEKQQKRGKKGGGGREQEPASQTASPYFSSPSLPAPWVAVPDPNTNRLYYWNQHTNEVTWTPPAMPSAASSSDMWAAYMQQAALSSAAILRGSPVQQQFPGGHADWQ